MRQPDPLKNEPVYAVWIVHLCVYLILSSEDEWISSLSLLRLLSSTFHPYLHQRMLLIMETLWTFNLLQRCPIAVQIDLQKKKTSNNKVLHLRENSEFGKNTFDSFFSFPNFKLEKSDAAKISEQKKKVSQVQNFWIVLNLRAAKFAFEIHQALIYGSFWEP